MGEVRDTDKYLILHEDNYEPYWKGFASLKEAEENLILHVACGNRPPILVKVEWRRTVLLRKRGEREKRESRK